MPFYLTRFSYTPETWARMAERPEDRRDAAKSYIGMDRCSIVSRRKATGRRQAISPAIGGRPGRGASDGTEFRRRAIVHRRRILARSECRTPTTSRHACGAPV